MNNSQVVITPLGGLGEIGLNCQLWESDKGIVMVDCGLMFPADEHLGVDVLIPHFAAISAIKDRLQGIVLTHGHEDHIGALPWVLPETGPTRIYGSPFTLALVRHKLKEHGLLEQHELCPVQARETLELADFTFHFFPVCHSIPEGFGLGVESPAGRIVHTGDFKLDSAPLSGQGTDLAAIRQFSAPGVRLLLSDSTNSMREGRSLTEREVKESLARVFKNARGRIVITLFSSHIQRIQEVFDLAREYGRAVVISGKSLANNIELAVEHGLARLPPEFHNAHYGVPELEDDRVVLMVTGAQGEPLSALSRMVNGNHRQLSIKNGDTVVMSSRVIPGNAVAVSRMINDMYRRGAEVLYESVHAVHASGHAHREELKDMIECVRPDIFVPIHGEYQHLVKHARLAEDCGIRHENIVVLEDGQPLALGPGSFEVREGLPVDFTLVDGKGVGDVGASVLRERRILGEEGMVIVTLLLDASSGAVLQGPGLISRGFVYEPHYSQVLEDASEIVLRQLGRDPLRPTLSDEIRASLRRFFRNELGRDPIVVPLVSLQGSCSCEGGEPGGARNAPAAQKQEKPVL